jgi:hypothetical protein
MPQRSSILVSLLAGLFIVLTSVSARAIEWEVPVGPWMVIPSFDNGSFLGCMAYTRERTSESFLTVKAVLGGRRELLLMAPGGDLPAGRVAPIRIALDKSGTLDAQLEVKTSNGGIIHPANAQVLEPLYREIQSGRSEWLGIFLNSARLDFPITQGGGAFAMLERCLQNSGRRPN